jgi:hypothetical protein
MTLLLEAPPVESVPAPGGGPPELSRDWLLAQMPLRKVGFAVGRALKREGMAPVQAALLRKGVVTSQDIGIVGIDVELGTIHVHEMGGGRYYLEASYTGTVDVDARLKYEDDFAGDKVKSYVLDLEVLAEVDVAAGRLLSFNVMDVDVI